MAINPFWSFSPTTPGISGASTGATAAGAGATAAEFPTWLIPILVSFLSSMFEKEKDPLEEAMNLKGQMGILGLQAPYQSSYAKGLDPIVAQALLSRLGQTSNWGWPAGKGMDTSFITDALQQLASGGFGSGLSGGIRRK